MAQRPELSCPGEGKVLDIDIMSKLCSRGSNTGRYLQDLVGNKASFVGACSLEDRRDNKAHKILLYGSQGSADRYKTRAPKRE